MAGIWLDNKKNPPAPNPYTNSAAIQGDSSYIGGIGVLASYGPYTVINSGTITAGASTVGAVVLLLGGAVTNQTGGVITGGLIGVDVEGAGPIVNYAMISGNYGVVARSSGYVSNAMTGTISGATDGIFVGQPNYNPPIYGGGSTGKVVNKGMVTATGSASLANGVVLNVAGAYVNNSGTIIGASTLATRTGIGVAENYGGTMVNSGMLRGGSSGFSAGGNPAHAGPATVTNTNSGTIIGSTYGVRLLAGGSIQNNGSIGSNIVYAIFLKIGGTVNNTGIINGGSVGIQSNAAATVTNTSVIHPTGQYGAGLIIAGGTVSNQSGGTILGNGNGIVASATTPSTIVNGGTIGSTAPRQLDYGITVNSGADMITNLGTGLIYGPGAGVFLRGGTLLNQGTIRSQGRATDGFGVRVFGASSITNASGATISGTTAGLALTSSSQSVIVNRGLITSAGAAVKLTASSQTSFVNYGTINGVGVSAQGVALSFFAGIVTNAPGGYINGGAYGLIDFGAPMTLVNAGTIGGGTKAVRLATGSGNLLQVVPGAVFKGNVDGGNVVGGGFQSTIQLLAGPTAGSLPGLGGAIYNFATITFAPGASWGVTGSSGGFTGGETFSGFAPGDSLQINGVTNETVAGFSANTLTLTGGATLDIIIPGNFDPSQFQVKNVGVNSVSVTVSCFAPETRIRMASGDEVPIMALRPGMRALTANGEAAEIVWVGRRFIDCRRHPRPELVCPVRVRAGAFGPGVPARDLRLSPDHAVFAHGVLIPVRCLINGVTIARESVDTITWFHLELPEHDIILAEGLPVESYLDTNDRADFNGSGTVRALFPAFAARRWEMAARAPLVMIGPEVGAVCDELAQFGGFATPAAGGGIRKSRTRHG
jgi:Hint domain